MKLIDKNKLLEELKKLKQNLSASPIVVIEDVESLVENLEVKEVTNEKTDWSPNKKMDIVIHNNQWYWGNTITLIRSDGMASVDLQCDNKCPTIAFIKGLMVHDTCRNQGIGNEMLDACFSEAIKLNKLFLQLNVLKDSWLVRWYERKGFIIIYEDDNEYTMWKQLDLRPQNKWKPSEGDIIILEKVIKGELEPKIFQATLQGILEQLKKLKGEV